MSTKKGKIGNHRFHGDPNRFEEVARFIGLNYQGKYKRIADVGGGQGMLARILKKRFNFEVDVIDPRGNTLVGVTSIKKNYQSESADFYDLIVGLHPDHALKEVVLSALIRPVLIIPCCNFWDNSRKLGRDALLKEIEVFFNRNKIPYQRITFDFEGPKNIGLISEKIISS